MVLVHAQDRILPEMKPKLGAFAQKILRKRGVELMLGYRLQAATGESAVLAGPGGSVTRPDQDAGLDDPGVARTRSSTA